MKKIKREYRKTYPLVRLYKNDVDDLIAVFEKYCKKVQLKADEYELDDASQLNNIGKETITELTINGRIDESSFLDGIRLRLSKDFISLTIDDDSNNTYLGMAFSITSILHRRAKIRAFLASIVRYFTFIGIDFLLITMTYILYETYKFNYIVVEIIQLISVILLVIYGTWFLYIKSRKCTIIYLVEVNKKPSFFKKNGENLLVNVLVAIVTVVLTLIGTWLVSRLR